MAISRLNVIFTKHHRIIFGVFAVLIIIAFVLADWIGGGGSFFGNSYGNDQAAEIFGKKVTRADLNDQMHVTSLRMLMEGRQVRSQEAVEYEALQDIAMKIMAERWKLTVSDEEVAKAIFAMPMFMDQAGKFDKASYDRVMTNFVKAQGFTENDFNEFLRLQLLTQKMALLQSEWVIVTDAERKSFEDMRNQQFKVLIATVKTADFVNQVKVEDKALNEYFQANRDKYLIPAKINALVVKFAPKRHLAGVKLTEEELKNYYEQNKDSFKVVKDKKESIPAFAQIREKVRAQAAAAKALEMAREEARKFAGDVYDNIADKNNEERLKSFKEFAAKSKLATVATGVFSAGSSKAGVVNSAELARVLSEVQSDMPLTEAVESADGSYVAFVTEYVPARQAELKEVAGKVKADFIQIEAAKLAEKRAAEVVNNLNAVKDVTARINRAKLLQTPKFTALKDFSLMTAREVLNDFNTFNAAAALNMLPGEVSKVMPGMDGFQIVVLESRQAAAADKAAKPADMEFMRYKYMNFEAAINLYNNANTKVMIQQEDQTPTAE